jgi:hypothetical protein
MPRLPFYQKTVSPFPLNIRTGLPGLGWAISCRSRSLAIWRPSLSRLFMLPQVETRAGGFDIQNEEPKLMMPNHTMQRMGASRSGHWQFLYQWRLAPTADSGRWAEVP